jgi:hypothetical protein
MQRPDILRDFRTLQIALPQNINWAIKIDHVHPLFE